MCLLLAALAIASTSYPNISSPHIEATNHITREIGVPDITAFDGNGTLHAVYECAKASCTDSESLGPCSAADNFGNEAPDAFGLYTNLTDQIHSLCSTVPQRKIIPDIAGPGVTLAYLIQAFVAMYGLLISRILSSQSTIGWLNSALLTFRIRKTLPVPCRLASTLSRLENSRLADATTNLLVEFQEAQCFFVFAIQVGLLYADSKGTSLMNVSSMQDYFVTENWIRNSALFILYPVLLTQINLRRAQRDSFYLLHLCALVVALGTGVYTKTHMPVRQDETWAKFANESPVDKCGGNSSLRTFCANESADYPYKLPNASVFVLALFATLLFEKLLTAARRLRWCQLQYSGLSGVQLKAAQYAESTATILLTLYYTASELYLVFLSGISVPFIFSLTSGEWNIGQLIAALVWAPVGAKYVYLIARKPKPKLLNKQVLLKPWNRNWKSH
ncbi:hypothetical protein F4780DRAFT_373596 [Xylariomycetidae sp. FL0641]|nr:hypothetical protein F4780DRAFT_373596 [Xylariomycetidae sp. FL0641]